MIFGELFLMKWVREVFRPSQRSALVHCLSPGNRSLSRFHLVSVHQDATGVVPSYLLWTVHALEGFLLILEKGLVIRINIHS